MSPGRPLLPLLLLLAACGGRGTPGTDGIQPVAGDFLERTLPAVVLLVAHRPDRDPGYGAGIVVDDRGLVLTNLHVVEGASTLGAFLHDPHRPSYSPLDGGLSRFLFENAGAEIPARRVRYDAVLDLALVRLEADTSAHGVLPLREEPVRVGEPVFALGHPQESVWTSTAGVVGALHQGLIQHDAAINRGNSGGPLVDAQGRVVGINTLKLFGGAEGMAFARPVGLARALLEEAGPPVELDLSDPGRALLSCERAVELAPAMVLDCVDWDALAAVHREALAPAGALLDAPPEVVARADALAQAEGWRSLVGRWQAGVMAFLGAAGEPMPPPTVIDTRAAWEDEGARAAHLEAVGARERILDAARALKAFRDVRMAEVMAANGLQEDFDGNPTAYREGRKRGLRVEEVLEFAPDRALVRAAGRNRDGSVFGYMECWERRDGAWRQHILCTAEDMAARPAHWPYPICDPEVYRRSAVIEAAMDLAGWTPEDLRGEPPWAPGPPPPGPGQVTGP